MPVKLSISIAELKAALPALARIAPRSASAPWLSMVRVERTRDGIVTLQVTDLDRWATYRLRARQPGQPLVLLAPIKALADAARAGVPSVNFQVLSAAVWSLNWRESGRLRKLEFKTFATTDWPAAPVTSGAPLRLTRNTVQAITEAVESASTDEARYTLCGVALDGRSRLGYVAATNGTVLFTCRCPELPAKSCVIIPRHKFLKHLDPSAEWTATIDTASICFASSATSFVSRLIEGDFAAWRRAVPAIDASWTTITLPPATAPALLAPLGYRKNQPVTVTLRATPGNGLQLIVPSLKSRAPVSVTVKARISGKPVASYLPLPHLERALRLGLRRIHIKDSFASIVFRGGNKSFVVIPCRPGTNDMTGGAQ